MNLMADSVYVELTSADPEKMIFRITGEGICLKQIEKKSDLTVCFTITRKSLAKTREICDKHDAKLQIKKWNGLSVYMKRLKGREILLGGLALAMAFSIFIPTRIFFIQINGNETIPSRQIVEAAQQNGIHFGASRRTVRSEKVKNALLSALPQLQWIGVNTSGCVANITVREREPEVNQEQTDASSSIVAIRDGYILSMEVSGGNPLCEPGMYVRRGEVLVSGYTDCGSYIRISKPEAEIMGQTVRTLSAVTPSDALLRKGKQNRTRKYSLLIGKKRINLWKGSGILDTTCGRIYEERYAALPGGFQLPVAFCVEEVISQNVEKLPVDEIRTQNVLCSFLDRYLSQQMIAGTIIKKEEFYSQAGGVCCLSGEYVCREMIGAEQQEMIGEMYVPNN